MLNRFKRLVPLSRNLYGKCGTSITIRIPDEIHLALVEKARQERTTLSDLCRDALTVVAKGEEHHRSVVDRRIVLVTGRDDKRLTGEALQ